MATNELDVSSAPPPAGSAAQDSESTGGSAEVRQWFAARRIAMGTKVGRYVVGRELGHGGMGIVYEADDRELGRKVALKWLLTQAPGEAGARGANRLLVEAQALAKLDHQNVVRVHDYGEHEGRMWLAMEYVPGMTLRRWVKERPRTWQEAVHVLTEAAHGVAAAHAAGLVHRDLKPDNVMIGRDDQVKVMDFGLAREEAIHEREQDLLSTAASTEMPSSNPMGASPRLTRTGARIGTPAYWAPEQWDGKKIDQATDQFAWCVMAWETLYGRRPFSGKSHTALAAAVHQGRIDPPPRGTRVPRWLRRILLRGLSADPRRRHPDMAHLLAALAIGPLRSRVTLALGVAIPVVASLLIGQQLLQARAIMRCDAEASRTVAELWNDGARERLRAGLARTGASFAVVTGDKVMPWLDAYAGTWRDAEAAVCRHEAVDRGWRPETIAEARRCLDDRRQYVDTLLRALSGATDDETGRGLASAAGPAIAALPKIAACLDERALSLRPRVLAEQGAEVDRIRALVVQAEALHMAGQYKDGLARVDSAQRAADELGWMPLRAEAAHRRGLLQIAVGDFEGARHRPLPGTQGGVGAGCPKSTSRPPTGAGVPPGASSCARLVTAPPT